MIPFFRPNMGEAEKAAAINCIERGWLTSGPKMREFEAELAKRVQAKHKELQYAYFSKAKTSKLGKIDLPDTVIQADVSRSKAKELVSSTRKVPPIKVAKIGGKFVVVDGHHRLAAAKARGDKKIDAELISPSKKSAFTY